MPAVAVVAGNALGFGGAARDHKIEEIQESDVGTKNIYDGKDTTLQGAICFKGKNDKGEEQWYALKAGFSKRGGAQEEGLYHQFLDDFPIPQNQAFWNKTLAEFVMSKYNSIQETKDMSSQSKNLIIENLCKVQAREYKIGKWKNGDLKHDEHIKSDKATENSREFQLYLEKNYDNLNKNFCYTLPNGNIVAHLFAPQCSKSKQTTMRLMYEDNLNVDEYVYKIKNSYNDLSTYIDDYNQKNENKITKVYATGVGAKTYAGGDQNKIKKAEEICNDFCKANSQMAVNCMEKRDWGKINDFRKHKDKQGELSHPMNQLQNPQPQPSLHKTQNLNNNSKTLNQSKMENSKKKLSFLQKMKAIGKEVLQKIGIISQKNKIDKITFTDVPIVIENLSNIPTTITTKVTNFFEKFGGKKNKYQVR